MRGAIYKGRVLSKAPVSNDWRDQYPGTVVTWLDGQRVDISVAELLAFEEVAFAMWEKPSYVQPFPPIRQHPKDISSSVAIVSYAEMPDFSDDRVVEKIHNMNLCSVEQHDDLWLLTFSNTETGDGFERAFPDVPLWISSLSLNGKTSLTLKDIGHYGPELCILDREAPIVQWLSNLRIAAAQDKAPINSADAEAVWRTATKWYLMDKLIERWADDPGIPESLKPPRDAEGDLLPFETLDLKGRRTILDD